MRSYISEWRSGGGRHSTVVQAGLWLEVSIVSSPDSLGQGDTGNSLSCSSLSAESQLSEGSTDFLRGQSLLLGQVSFGISSESLLLSGVCLPLALMPVHV